LRRSIAPDAAAAGFTLIEVLVALAIVALALSSIWTLMGTSFRGVGSMEERLARLETARAVVAALPDRDQPTGALSGKIDGRSWRVEATPLSAAPPPSASSLAWIPHTIVVSVRSPSGGLTEIRTVRLQQRAGQ